MIFFTNLLTMVGGNSLISTLRIMAAKLSKSALQTLTKFALFLYIVVVKPIDKIRVRIYDLIYELGL